MALFSPRLFPEIMADMIARLLSVTPLNDLNYGGVWTTMLEAAAQEDDEQYFQMLEIIRGYSLDTIFGDDLDDRAFEYGVSRDQAKKASTKVTLGDDAVTKIETGVFAGLSGSPAGATYVYGNTSTGFTTTGSIIIGRGTSNVEKVPYSSITIYTNYVKFNLSSALAKDHGTDETIILAQGNDRLISAGTVVKVPASDISAEVLYTLDAPATILDGEEEVTEVPVTATVAGAIGNVPIGAIQIFDTKPFSTATVRNPVRVTNGLDVESDQALRDKIKNRIQSLSRGTATAIITGVIGIISESDNKRAVSVSLREPTIPADVVKLFLDDGTGFVPTFNHVGIETVVPAATGGEKYLNVENFPVVKAFVETSKIEPFSVPNLSTLFVEVNGVQETILFVNSDFAIPGSATAQEVLEKINFAASLFEARLSSDKTKLRIFARSNIEEEIRVVGGTANTALGFATDTKYTTKLYVERNNTISILNKDGKTAAIESGSTAAYDFSSLLHLSIVVDGKVKNILKAWFDPNDFPTPASVTALQTATVISDVVPGVDCIASSGSTRVTIASKNKRNANSKIRIVSDFTKAFNEESSVLIDRTTEIKSSSSNIALFAALNDYLYLGHSDVPFDSIFAKFVTPSSDDIEAVFEYYNGTTWVPFGVTDGTVGFTQDGHILWQAPPDWAQTTVETVVAYWIRIQRTAVTVGTVPIESRLRICGANEKFSFNETEVAGSNKDYSLNRFIGQIELESTLQANDKVTLGSDNTRGFVVATNFGNYSGLVGETLTLYVDGLLKTITFVSGDFVDPDSISPLEVATAINARVFGVTATDINSNSTVKIITNKWNGGSIKIDNSGANFILGFPIDQVNCLVSNIPAIESTIGPWTFAPNDSLLVIVDNNFAAAFTVAFYKQSELTGVTSTSVVTDSALIPIFTSNDEIVGYDLYMVTGAQAGQRKEISDYVAATGQITLATPLSGLPAVGDEYQIIPKSISNVVSFLNNKQITLLSNKVEVSASDGGRRLQFASYNTGDSAIAVSGGNANLQLSFPGEALGIDGYRYFTGLAQEVQWTVDGKAEDQENYPGIRAGGVQVEVIEPVKIPVTISIDITATEGTSLGNISSGVKSAISNYINRLDVGGDVVLSEIIVAVKRVTGVKDAVINSPTENIAIADNELARITDSGILIA
jgi:uncharacterized phage protein gp47/JayE